MPSESSEKRGAKANQVPGAPPPEPEQLQCPRCDSKNTKFCYYNNYNFAQPRHFCKSCRRYWTRGGTLRDIPVGGGSRKNARRSRTLLPNLSSSTTSAPDFIRRLSSPITSHSLAPLNVDHVGPEMSSGVSVCGSFTSLLNTEGPGFFALGGFGGGIEEIGRAVWPFQGFGIGDAGGSGGAGSVFGNRWFHGGGGIGNGDCFTLADVSAPRVWNGTK